VEKTKFGNYRYHARVSIGYGVDLTGARYEPVAIFYENCTANYGSISTSKRLTAQKRPTFQERPRNMESVR